MLSTLSLGLGRNKKAVTLILQISMCIHAWAHSQVWVSMKGSDILTNVCINMRVLYIWHLTYIWQDLAIPQNLLF